MNTDQSIIPSSFESTSASIHHAVEKAHAVFEEYKRTPVSNKILFLQNIIHEIQAISASLIPITHQETALPAERLKGELQRTTKQINLFIGLLKEGSWVKAVIDTKETPLPDIRQMQIPLGVVAVFGASNFPYAFSVAGGDTIAALAAGCPVVYKAHPGHPRTSDLVGDCIMKAAAKSEVPANVFALVHGSSNEVGQKLVMHPQISAVAFTGSFRGGKALYDAAAKRETPIPVYAEMGSINPVFILPEILEQSSEEIAAKVIHSNLLGTGQFCTNPGVIILPPSDANNFLENSAELVRKSKAGTMLTDNIYLSYLAATNKVRASKGVQLFAEGKETGDTKTGVPHLFVTTAEDFLQDEILHEEVFGPTAVCVKTNDKTELYKIAGGLRGQLTATVWGTENDLKHYAALLQILENKAGRLIINGVPTGVEITAAMVHGGPFPATTDSKITSVGSSAIYRFTRPVCYQNFPQNLLPHALKNDNPLKIWRLVNGELSKDEISA